MRLLYAIMAHVKNEYRKLPMTKSKKNNNKAKLNLTVREEQRNKLEQMASLENRSVSTNRQRLGNKADATVVWQRI
jgi:hypothetical protein